MDGRDEERIEALVFEYLERREGGDAPFEELRARHPELASRFSARVRALLDAGFVAPEIAVDHASDEPPDFLGEFRLIRRIGGGSMGVVYLAEQTSLGRRVALKLIRPEQVYFPGARQRFRREVEVVARLAHPNVVPVHAVGEERGVPYFAMELVAGPSLADVIEALAGREPASLRGSDLAATIERLALAHPASTGEVFASNALFSGSYVDACLRLARQAAEALEHAHRRGVLHRDVKPSNVLATPDGRALLVDFGLASSSTSQRLTNTGSQVGSLLYMPPESLIGRGAEPDVRCDIYSLGVTLCELLILRSPFDAESRERLVLDISAGRIRPPRAGNPAISAELETVLRKALDPEPARRYASADAFARDLTNLLERRPVEARRAGPILRARRWSQRHPGGAAAFALAFAVALGGPLVYAHQQRGARLALEAEQGRTESQRERAEANLARAMQALELLTRVGDRDLRNVPQASDARRELLEAALAFYDELAASERGAPELSEHTARAEMAAGVVLAALARNDEARTRLRSAISDYESLAEMDPAERARHVASCLETLALVDSRTGEPASAEQSLDRSIALAEGLAQRSEATPQDAVLLVRQLRKRAELLRESGRLDEAAQVLDQARPLASAFSPEDAASPEARFERAQLLNESGILAGLRSGPEEALEEFDRASEAYEALYAERPEDGPLRDALAIVHSNIARSLGDAGRHEGEEEHLARALELSRTLVEDFPLVPGYRLTLVGSTLNLSAVLLRSDRYDEALTVLESGREHARRLVADSPDSIEYAAYCNGIESNLGALYQKKGQYEAAREVLEPALERVRALLAHAGANAVVRQMYRGCVVNLANVLFDLGRYPEALDLATQNDVDEDRALGLLVNLATRCVASARADESLDEAEREDRAWEYGERTVELMRRFNATGYTRDDLEHLEQNERWDPLRGHPRFEELLAEMRAKLGESE